MQSKEGIKLQKQVAIKYWFKLNRMVTKREQMYCVRLCM